MIRQYPTKISYIVIFLIISILIWTPIKVNAASNTDPYPIESFTQQDLDGNGSADVATIISSYQSMPIKIMVYDQGGNMNWSDTWQEGTDFVDDCWIFQNENGESTKLIINFSHSQKGYQAELYDDFNGDENVFYQIVDGKQVNITESIYPAIRISAKDPWILSNGTNNYVVRLQAYRPDLARVVQPEYQFLLPDDGSLDYEQEIVDTNEDQVPDYALSRAFPRTVPGLYPFTASLVSFLSDWSRPNFSSPFFWPYLDLIDPNTWDGKLERRPEDYSPPIKFSWIDSLIMGDKNFLPMWEMGNEWIIFSNLPIQKGMINNVDWETWGFYDFNNDPIMDMMVRGVYHPDNIIKVGDKDFYLHQVSYAWHFQNLDQIRWDYELEMAKPDELPKTVVQFPDFAVRAVPFQDLLSTYTQQNDWAFATFVAADGGSGESNEGIWEWGTLEGVMIDLTLPADQISVPGSMQAQRNYLLGKVDQSPADYYYKIRQGYRGEYAVLNGPANLYFSPIDHKLHLLKASRGMWNLDGTSEIRYANLGGETIDQWSLWQDRTEQKSLTSAAGSMILAENQQIQIKQTVLKPILFTTLPPTNKAEWNELGKKLEKYKPTFAPDDFQAMYDQFSGPEFTIDGGEISDFRLTEDGYRFVLELFPGYIVSGADWPGIEHQAPGKYLVEFTDAARNTGNFRPVFIPLRGKGANSFSSNIPENRTSKRGEFSIMPLTPVNIQLELTTNIGNVKNDLDLSQVKLKAINTGNQDSSELEVVITADCGNEPVELMRKETKLLGEEQQEWSANWQEMPDRDCRLLASLTSMDDVTIAQTEIELPATSNFRAQEEKVLRASTLNFHRISVGSLLGLLGILTAMIYGISWISQRKQKK